MHQSAWPAFRTKKRMNWVRKYNIINNRNHIIIIIIFHSLLKEVTLDLSCPRSWIITHNVFCHQKDITNLTVNILTTTVCIQNMQLSVQAFYPHFYRGINLLYFLHSPNIAPLFNICLWVGGGGSLFQI